LEIIIAGVYLYQCVLEPTFYSIFCQHKGLLRSLLGLSAFAGFIVLVAGWPLNTFLGRRSVKIQKGFAVVRDKRTTVISELVQAIKFVKFFAWEKQWIDRVMAIREVEMKWLIKGT